MPSCCAHGLQASVPVGLLFTRQAYVHASILVALSRVSSATFGWVDIKCQARRAPAPPLELYPSQWCARLYEQRTMSMPLGHDPNDTQYSCDCPSSGVPYLGPGTGGRAAERARAHTRTHTCKATRACVRRAHAKRSCTCHTHAHGNMAAGWGRACVRARATQAVRGQRRVCAWPRVLTYFLIVEVDEHPIAVAHTLSTLSTGS